MMKKPKGTRWSKTKKRFVKPDPKRSRMMKRIMKAVSRKISKAKRKRAARKGKRARARTNMRRYGHK